MNKKLIMLGLVCLVIFTSGCLQKGLFQEERVECIGNFHSEIEPYREDCFNKACGEFNLSYGSSFNAKEMTVRCDSENGFGIDVDFSNTGYNPCNTIVWIIIKHRDCL